MSFTSEVKQEICRSEMEVHCMKAQLSAFIQMTSTLNLTSTGTYLTCRTENVSCAKRMFSLLKRLYQADIELSVMKKIKLKKNNVYILKVKDKAMEILKDLDILSEKGLRSHPTSRIVKKDCCRRAYLSGAFLAGGSVNSPTTSNYHLEIATSDESQAKYIQKQMARFNIQAKIIQRRNQFVAYVKASDQISQFLKCVGASDSLFAFEDHRIQRDFMNNLTRLDNCELANEMKSLQAGQRQVEDIEWIEKYKGLKNLPEHLSSVALLRKENPEASLNELCELYEQQTGETLSKSGMRHRLNKLKEYADEYRNQENPAK